MGTGRIVKYLIQLYEITYPFTTSTKFDSDDYNTSIFTALKKDGEIKKNPLVADDLTEENNLYFLLVNIYITYRYMTKFTYCLITLYKVASFKLT